MKKTTAFLKMLFNMDLSNIDENEEYAALLSWSAYRPATRYDPEEPADVRIIALYRVIEENTVQYDADLLPTLTADQQRRLEDTLNDRYADEAYALFSDAAAEDEERLCRLRRRL